MCRYPISIWLLAVVFFLDHSAWLAAQAPPEPIRAAFSHERLFYTTPGAVQGFHNLPLVDLGETKRVLNDLSFDNQTFRSGPHWHLGYGQVWFTYFERFVFRCDLKAYIQGKVVTHPDDSPEDRSHYVWTIPADHVESLLRQVRFKRELFHDFVPVASNRVQLLVLTNVRGTIRPITSGDKEGLVISAYEPIVTDEDKKTPYWSMTVHECTRDWDKKQKEWSDYEWKLVEKIVPLFQEQFQIVMQGNNYFFITASGKLYRTGARRILTGRRVIEPVWTDATRPITHFLTDADADRTFLFCQPAKKGEPGVFFELGPKPDPKPYDLTKVKPTKADEPLKSVLERARFLADQRLLKNP